MLAGTHFTGMVHVRAQSQVLMKNMIVSHGKSISSVKQLVQDMDLERMKDLNVPMLTDQVKIFGIVTGKILDVWKLQEMLAGIRYSGTIVVRAQSQVLMKFIRQYILGKITLNVKRLVQDMDLERMKDLSVPMSIDQTKIFGIATGKILDVWKLQEMLAGIQNSGTIHAKVQN